MFPFVIFFFEEKSGHMGQTRVWDDYDGEHQCHFIVGSIG